MSLTIIKPGIFDTIQDTGRVGFGNWGVNMGGAMDKFAAQSANCLVGNCTSSAVLEMHFPAPQIMFEQNSLIAITGAACTPTLNGEPIECFQPIVVRKNSLLQFEASEGARIYLAVHGGFCLNKWLGSYSTNIKANMGGFEGRKLQKGDELVFGDSQIYYSALLTGDQFFQKLPWRSGMQYIYENAHTFFISEGREWHLLDAEQQANLFNQSFTIHPSSDRMGFRLQGKPIHVELEKEMISTAVNYGTVQLMPDGQLITLMADHQTTGGYPRLAHVISAHLPKLAQCKPGTSIRFQMVTKEEAESLLLSMQQDLQVLKKSCKEKLEQFYAVH